MRLSKNRKGFAAFLQRKESWFTNCNYETCPIAVFLRETKPGSKAEVRRDSYSIYGVDYHNPPWVANFVRNFDSARLDSSAKRIGNLMSFLRR